jgi:predicted nuclease with TOPRIM domain
MENQEMNDRLFELEEKMTSIDKKLTQVVDAILGNPLTKTGGFINDIRDLQNKVKEFEDKLEKHEEFKKRFSWTIGLVIVIGLIIQYFSNLYSNIK